MFYSLLKYWLNLPILRENKGLTVWDNWWTDQDYVKVMIDVSLKLKLDVHRSTWRIIFDPRLFLKTKICVLVVSLERHGRVNLLRGPLALVVLLMRILLVVKRLSSSSLPLNSITSFGVGLQWMTKCSAWSFCTLMGLLLVIIYECWLGWSMFQKSCLFKMVLLCGVNSTIDNGH